MLKAHPYADLFPLMADDDLRRLADDIKANGQREDIYTLEGLVLDGRNRLRACDLAGTEPRFKEYDGADPLGFVLSKNLHRRHLTESQRAMVAASLANMSRGDFHGNQHEVSAQMPIPEPKVSQAKAAELLNVGERTLREAKKVIESGVPELAEAVKKGEATVKAAAKVATLPKSEQRKAVKEGKVKEKAAEQRKDAPKPSPAPAAEPVNQQPDQPDDDSEQPPTPAEEDPSDTFCEVLNTLCRDLDGIGQRVAALKDSPYGRFVHWQSAQVQIKNGRETLWQGRPTHQCPYCRKAGELQPNCRCCGGLNVCTKQSYKAGVAAVGEVEE